jgi:hypothetical protein
MYLRKKSTNNAIQSFSKKIQEGDSGLQAVGILCDITKAYNVSHHG